MRALIASPLGFLIGLSLGAIGGGGSVLAIPVLVYVAGQTPAQATTTSLIVVGAASAIGIAGHWRAGRVRPVEGTLFGLVGIGGSFLGTFVNESINGEVLLLLFAALILVAAWRMKTACPSCTNEGTDKALDDAEPGEASTDTGAKAALTTRTRIPLNTTTVLKVLAAGTAIGFLTGLFGVGGGFVIVPALTLILKFDMPEAIGTSILVIAINAATALVARAGSPVDWATTIPFAIAAIAGVLAGKKVADKLPAQKLLNIFAGLLVAVGTYTGIQALVALL